MTNKNFTFIHLTDTHMNAAGKQEGDFAKFNLAEKVKQAFQHAKDNGVKPDFALITGDLVHEGDATDYVYARSLLDECSELIGAPIHVVLGNHDHRAPFRQGFLGELPSEEPYYYSHMYDGLRLIGLNTQVEGDHGGIVDDEQMAWLAEQLKTPAPEGTIIAIHHPILTIGGFGGDHHLLKNREAFGNLIEGTDVLAVMAGHVHSNNVGTYKGICSVAASGTAFIGDLADPEHFVMVNKASYNVVTANASQGVSVRTVEIPTDGQVYVKFPLALLVAATQH